MRGVWFFVCRIAGRLPFPKIEPGCGALPFCRAEGAPSAPSNVAQPAGPK